MTIQEAIKSGKPFRRKHTSDWAVTTSYQRVRFQNGEEYLFTPECLLADDWEIKQSPMVVYLNVYPDGALGGPYHTERRAQECADAKGKTVKFVEVIE